MDDSEPITEYTIAVDVLSKSPDFKDSKDAAVRVEVHRLRKRLAEYYEQEGAHDPIRIVIPTGQYVPSLCCVKMLYRPKRRSPLWNPRRLRRLPN